MNLRTIRLHVQPAQPFSLNELHRVEGDQAHYLLHVMRVKQGQELTLFNARDGAFLARVVAIGKRNLELELVTQLAPPPPPPNPDILLCMAPIKAGPMGFLVEKATELGVAGLLPVQTERTVVRGVNSARLLRQATEASEQCERLDVPCIGEETSLPHVLAKWEEEDLTAGRTLLWCDENGSGASLGDVAARVIEDATSPCRVAILIGPEGGFSAKEQALLQGHAQTVAVGLGPRVLRAETAALVACTLMQAAGPNWREAKPTFDLPKKEAKHAGH